MVQENILDEQPEPGRNTGQTAPSPQHKPAHPSSTASAPLKRAFPWMFAFFAAIAVLSLVLGLLLGFLAGLKAGQHDDDRGDRHDRGGMICMESYPMRCYYPDFPYGTPHYYGTDDGSVVSPPMPGMEEPVGTPEPAPMPRDEDVLDVPPTDPSEAPTGSPSAP